MHCIEVFHRSVLCCKCIVWCCYRTLCPGFKKKKGFVSLRGKRKVGDFRIHRKGKLWHHKQKGSLNYSKQCLSLVLTYWISCLSVSKPHLPVSSMLLPLICCLCLLGWHGGVTTAGPKQMANQKTSADAFDNSSISEISAKNTLQAMLLLRTTFAVRWHGNHSHVFFIIWLLGSVRTSLMMDARLNTQNK